MHFINLSPVEQSSGQLSSTTLTRATTEVNLNGFVVFENALPTDFVDTLREDWTKVLNELLEKDPSKTEINSIAFRKNRIRMDLPFRAPYSDSRVITNAFAMPVIEKILGTDCRTFYFSADAPMPGSEYQSVHGDYAPFYPGADIILPITALVLNIPLVDVTKDNGPMDVWPNTHLTPEKYFEGSFVKEAAAGLEPVSMKMPKGSLLVRDIRMWHRGTPNYSKEARPMLSIIYAQHWWDGAVFPQKTLGITAKELGHLSDRAKQLFRFEKLLG